MSTVYKDAVLEHYRAPRNFGELANADVSVRERNPLCGDHITLYLSFDAGRRLKDVRFFGRGCVLTMASASTLTERIAGKSLQELHQLGSAPLLELLDAEPTSARMKCVNLSLEALRRGLAMYERGAAKGTFNASGVAPDLFDHVGNTPLVRLKPAVWGLPPRVQLLAKLEAMNPARTVKARSVLAAIQAAMAARNPLLPGMELLDVMTGSAGIALAVIGARMGFATKLIVPATVPEETKRVLRAYGTSLHVLVDRSLDARAAADIARQMRDKSPERIFFLDLLEQPAPWTAHYPTGAEIVAQAGQPITHLVAGVGSGATLTGIARRLKEHDPATRVCAVVPAEGDRIEGLRAPGAGGASLLDASLVHETLEVSAKESEERAKQLAKQEGLLVGTSSGAALAASLRLASRLEEGTIVTVFPDDGQRYLDEPYWLYDY